MFGLSGLPQAIGITLSVVFDGKRIFVSPKSRTNFRGGSYVANTSLVQRCSGEVVEAFEESDGISFIGHTLDKCAMAGVMMAINTLVLTSKNLSEQYIELQKKYGYFYPDKAGADVKGMCTSLLLVS